MCLQIHCDLPHGSEVVSSFGMRADLGETSIVLLPPELPDEGIEGGREHEAEAGHAYHPEQYGCSQRLPHLCTGTGCDRKRGDAQDERQRGHQGRAEPRCCCWKARSVHSKAMPFGRTSCASSSMRCRADPVATPGAATPCTSAAGNRL